MFPALRSVTLLRSALVARASVARAASSSALPEDRENNAPQRCGLLAVKKGMSQVWDYWGVRLPVTVLEVLDCQVTQVKTKETDGYTALQIGGGPRKLKRTTKPMRGHFWNAGVDPKRWLREFRVSEDAILPVGTELSAMHFVSGQLVDVAANSIGKGFAGTMKRHNFSGQGASHGVSKTHRMLGSIGACQDPGRVWKGKKMSGRLGNKRVTTQNLLVYMIDPRQNYVVVHGAVPGHKGALVEIRDAVKGATRGRELAFDIPVPTFTGDWTELSRDAFVAPHSAGDPLDFERIAAE